MRVWETSVSKIQRFRQCINAFARVSINLLGESKQSASQATLMVLSSSCWVTQAQDIYHCTSHDSGLRLPDRQTPQVQQINILLWMEPISIPLQVLARSSQSSN